MTRPALLAVAFACLAACSARPGADLDSPYLVSRVYPADPTTTYRAAYQEARDRGWGILAEDRLLYSGREFLALTPGDGRTLDAQVSISVAGVSDGSRVLIRSQIEDPPADGEIQPFLDSLAVRLGPPVAAPD